MICLTNYNCFFLNTCSWYFNLQLRHTIFTKKNCIALFALRHVEKMPTKIARQFERTKMPSVNV